MIHNSVDKIFARRLLYIFVALCALGTVLLLIPVPIVHAASFTVDRFDDIASATVCTGAPNDCSLRGAIIAANANPGADTITLPSGTYTLTLVGTGEDAAANGDLDITDDLTIIGTGASIPKIDGNGGVTGERVIHIPYTTTQVALNVVTITGGIASGPEGGGGISNNGTLTITATFIYGNSASNAGGGIRNGGSLNIIGGYIYGNSASYGGGINSSVGLTMSLGSVFANSGVIGGGINAGGIATIKESAIYGNGATEGGGISDGIGTINVISTSISGNSAANAGGIRVYSGTVVLTSTTVSGNHATSGNGGGILAKNIFTATNSTISGNTGSDTGGGIYNEGGTTSLNNATIANNSASGLGGGGGIKIISGTVNLRNTIVAGNLASAGPDCVGVLTSQGYNLVQNTAVCSISSTNNILGQNPKLGPLQNNGSPMQTHALLAASPAIDAGNPSGCTNHTGAILTTDERGILRHIDGNTDATARCDIGAYEAQIHVMLPLILK